MWIYSRFFEFQYFVSISIVFFEDPYQAQVQYLVVLLVVLLVLVLLIGTFSLSNQGECQLPETIFELLISWRIMVRNFQAFLPQLHGEQKMIFGAKN